MNPWNFIKRQFDGVPGADRVWKQQLEAYARNGLGAAYAGLGQSDLALEQFGKSIEVCPDNAWVYFNRAEAFHNSGDQVKAVED
jgi:tetratricopeptide (TPR) repeat protein